MTTATSHPTVYLVIGDKDNKSAIAYSVEGEILETVDWNEDGSPDWSNAGICDHRGGGGDEGYQCLNIALDAAERNAVLVGYEATLERVAD